MTSIALFSVPEPRKNNFVQYHGFLLARRKKPDLILETNVITDQKYNFINNYGWLEKDSYEKIIKNCKLVLCIHPFESLNYQVIEVIKLGTIPIISPAVRDNLGLLYPNICVNNVDSPLEISWAILETLKSSKEEYDFIIRDLQEDIQDLAKKNNKELKKVLEENFK